MKDTLVELAFGGFLLYLFGALLYAALAWVDLKIFERQQRRANGRQP